MGDRVDNVRVIVEELEGVSPLDHWEKVDQLSTQAKPYNTLPPM